MIWLSLILLKTWGMELVDKERRYTRHVKFTGPGGEDIECRLVYDYCQSCYVAPRCSFQLGFYKQILQVDGLRRCWDFIGRLTTIMMIKYNILSHSVNIPAIFKNPDVLVLCFGRACWRGTVITRYLFVFGIVRTFPICRPHIYE